MVYTLQGKEPFYANLDIAIRDLIFKQNLTPDDVRDSVEVSLKRAINLQLKENVNEYNH